MPSRVQTSEIRIKKKMLTCVVRVAVKNNRNCFVVYRNTAIPPKRRKPFLSQGWLLVTIAFLFPSTLPPEVGRKLIDETRPASELSIVSFFERDRPNLEIHVPPLKFDVATTAPGEQYEPNLF